MLADAIQNTLPELECVYFGAPDEKALMADRIFVGFWTDKGNCDSATAEFLKHITNQEVFLYGTAGFGENEEYFQKILRAAQKHLSKDAKVIGTYMCQGKMPMAVRARYEKMKGMPNAMPNLDGMIENFDKALSHPDTQDLEALKASLA